jgi:hypothetical protein
MCQFFQNLSTIGDHGTIFLQNDGIWLPRDAVSYPRTETSATLLWQFKACKIFIKFYVFIDSNIHAFVSTIQYFHVSTLE